MKKHITFSLVYAILAMVCGVFYREFTKFNDFTGVTTLGKVHTHLFVLGMLFFLIFALFDGKFNLQQHKLYKPFIIIYNCGVGLTSVMLIVRGICQVCKLSVSDGAIAGIAGIGHMILGAGIILFFIMVLKSLKTQS